MKTQERAARHASQRLDIRAIEAARARKILGREATQEEADELTRERWEAAAEAHLGIPRRKRARISGRTA